MAKTPFNGKGKQVWIKHCHLLGVNIDNRCAATLSQWLTIAYLTNTSKVKPPPTVPDVQHASI